MDLHTSRMKLAEIFPDVAKTWAKKLHIKADAIEYVRKGIPIDPANISIEEGERAAIRLISTPHLDRDGEILIPSGAMLDDFRKNPVVLYAHDYSGLPVGKDIWIKPTNKGILVKTIYASHQFADDVYGCVKGGFLNTSSAGFIPIEVIAKGEKGFDAWQTILEKEYGIAREESGQAKRIYTKWAMLEHSDVPVPSNADSLNLLVGKGISARLKKDMGVPDAETSEETKTADADGNPSVDDIRCAINMALNPPAEPQIAADDPAAIEMNKPQAPFRYVCDLFPVDFPSGHFTYSESTPGEMACHFYRQDYIYADDMATLEGEAVEVMVTWAEKGVDPEQWKAIVNALHGFKAEGAPIDVTLQLMTAILNGIADMRMDVQSVASAIATLREQIPLLIVPAPMSMPDICEPPALQADLRAAVIEIKAAIAAGKAIDPMTQKSPSGGGASDIEDAQPEYVNPDKPPIVIPVPAPTPEDTRAAVADFIKSTAFKDIVKRETTLAISRLKGKVE